MISSLGGGRQETDNNDCGKSNWLKEGGNPLQIKAHWLAVNFLVGR